MAYSSGPYARFPTLPVPPRPEVSSARNVDFTTLRYTLNGTTGGFESMPPTVQRVIMLIMFGVDVPKFNTAQERNAIALQIRAALEILTQRPGPLIELREVTVERDAAGSAVRKVVFRDLTRGTDIDDTVQLT